MAQSNYDGKLDQLAIWDTDKGAGDFLAALYNEGEGRIIESNEEDLVLLSLFNENYDDSTGTFTSPTLTGNETYDDPLVTDARGPLEPKARFIPGLAMIDAEGDAFFYLEDALGSVMALADEEEDVVGVYQYDAWGNVLVEPEDDTNPYRWCGTWGYFWDVNAEMYLLGLRWYEPRAGRFITPDPIGFDAEDMNLYRPMRNNPTSDIDIWGLDIKYKGTIWRGPSVVDLNHPHKFQGVDQGVHLHEVGGSRKYFPKTGRFLDTKTKVWSEANPKWRQGFNETCRKNLSAGKLSAMGLLAIIPILVGEVTGENERMVKELTRTLLDFAAAKERSQRGDQIGYGEAMGHAAVAADLGSKLFPVPFIDKIILGILARDLEQK
jgi:RHS repeat-associated protein